MKKIKKQKIGGMALFDGLLLRSKTKEVITRIDKDNEVSVEINNLAENKKNIITKIPVVRGIISLISTIKSSIPYIVDSAKEVLDAFIKDEDDFTINKPEIVASYIVAIFLILSFVIIIPNVASLFFTSIIQNIVQVILQIIMFSIYLYFISKIKYLGEIFEYHGAEHKVINAYENLKEEEITLDNVKKQSRFHKRCGGNFVIYLFMLLVLTSLLIPSTNILVKSIIQIMALPVVIGIAYELVMLVSSLPKFLKFISYPAMLIQFITTKEPSEEKIQLAIHCVFACISEKTEITIGEYIKSDLQQKYKNTNINLNEALRIIAYVKKVGKDELYVNINSYFITYTEKIKLDKLFYMYYIKKIPLQYIIGLQEFFKEEYIVTKNVLIPRADTEVLVETAIDYIIKNEFNTMIDMCTGSGCIAISVANNSNIEKVYASDISKDALAIVIKNIKKNKVDEKVYPIHTNLFEFFIQNNIKCDIITSNPPYISTKEMDILDEYVKSEPKLALDGGKTGIEFYIRILKEAKQVLNSNGILIFEIGYNQLESIEELVNEYTEFDIIEKIKDLSGNDRVVVCRFLRILKTKF